MNRPFDTDEPVDVVEEQLAEWDARLERGEEIAQASSVHSTNSTQERLHKGLACLKQLNNIRRRRGDSTTPGSTNTAGLLATVSFKLPCGFGKFELIQQLGRGGFGIVFLARDRILDSHVALKMPHSHVLTNNSLRQRFIREARVAAGLQHPHIVPVHEAGEIGPVNYIVYAYCPGITLADWLRSQKEQVSAQKAATWLASLAEAVAYAHSKGVMHRDLKPANILLHSSSDTDTNYIPRITDFGLAKLEREEHHTATGAILGTPMYMAPEQANSKATITPAADVHALGVLLYELLAGHPPFRGESDYDTLQLVANQEPLPLRKVRPRLPADLETICLKCLQKDPILRYSSAQELADDLHRFLKGEPIHARPVSWFERSWRLCQRHPLVSGLLIALCLTIASGVAGVLYQNHERGVQADAAKAWLQKFISVLLSETEEGRRLLNDPATVQQGRQKLISLLPKFDALLADPQTELWLQHKVAELATEVGSVHTLLFEHEKAAFRYQQAVDIYDQLTKKPGNRFEVLKAQSRALSQLAFSLRNLKKWSESFAQYQAAIELGNQLLQQDSKNAKSYTFIANCMVFSVFNLQEMKRFDEIEPILLLAQTHVQNALELDPYDTRIQQNQALLFDDLGLHYLRQKKRDKAKSNLEKGLAIRMSIQHANPKLFGIGEEIARSHHRLGLRAYQLGDFSDAEDHYRSAIWFNDVNARNNPEVPNFANNAAWDRITLCNLFEEQKRFSEEAELLDETIKVRLDCYRKFPQHIINHQELVNNHFKLAWVYRILKKSSEAESTVMTGITLHEQYLNANPSDKQFQDLWISRLQWHANNFETERKTEQAIKLLAKLVTVREARLTANSSAKEQLQHLENHYAKLALLYRSQNLWQSACTATTQAIHHLLSSKSPSSLKLAEYYYNAGCDKLELKKYDQALEPFQQALHHYQQNTSTTRKSVDRELANTRLRLGCIQLMICDYKQAHQTLSAAEPYFHALYRQQPSTINIQNLAQCHSLLSQSAWFARHDPFLTTWHYTVSSCLTTRYTGMPIKPDTAIRLAYLYLKANPGKQ